jgi:hypothetical protein
MSESKKTTDHETIRRWASERGGKPAHVKGTGKGGDEGVIRIMFPDAPVTHHDKLEEITWEEFFDKFEDSGLALAYQEETRGAKSNFHKLVSR